MKWVTRSGVRMDRAAALGSDAASVETAPVEGAPVASKLPTT